MSDDEFSSLTRQLNSPERQSALRTLLEAAQFSPQACEVLIQDALARDDLIQADYWQGRKAQLSVSPASPGATTKRKVSATGKAKVWLVEPSTKSEPEPVRKKSKKSSMWVGFVGEVGDGGGEF